MWRVLGAGRLLQLHSGLLVWSDINAGVLSVYSVPDIKKD